MGIETINEGLREKWVKKLATATARARKKGLRARRLSETQFEVPSQSEVAKFYIVTLQHTPAYDYMTCTCLGNEQYMEVCIHCGAANLGIQSEADLGNDPASVKQE